MVILFVYSGLENTLLDSQPILQGDLMQLASAADSGQGE